MNYAKTQPELVILAVNTFVKVRLRSNLSAVPSSASCSAISDALRDALHPAPRPR
jgi:hypothetical protein